MNITPELHQRLLELVYGLLDDDDAAELRRQMATEPALTEALSFVERQCGLFAEAARLELPLVALAPPQSADASTNSNNTVSRASHSSTKTPSPHPLIPSSPHRLIPSSPPLPQSAIRNPRSAIHWSFSLAAGLLLVISLGGFMHERLQVAALAERHLRLLVVGPAVPRADAPNVYTVDVASAAGKRLAADVVTTLYSPTGDEIWRNNERTDDRGELRVRLPPSDDLAMGARLVIRASHGEALETVETRLAVEPSRHVTKLSLDKPIYRPGETVYYRSLTLSRFALESDLDVPVHFEIRDPSGAIVSGSEAEGITRQGVGNGAFPVPYEQAGGAYTLVARSLDESFPEERREFFIRDYRLPRLKTELEFARDSYAPGDLVLADFSAQRAEGGAAADAKLTITALVDGQVVHQQAAEATAGGTAQIEFTLPEQMAAGVGQLAVAVDDGGNLETIAKTIPINLGKVDVTFYPEGGELVAGLENRIYFVGRDPLGKPVHVEGRVIDDNGREVARLETKHEGMGTFALRPDIDRTYTLDVAKPADVTFRPQLPAVSGDKSLVISAGPGVFDPGRPLELKLSSIGRPRPLVVTAFCRGVQVGQQTVDMAQGTRVVSLALAPEAGGMVRVTVYDYGADPPQPLAERLVYRRTDRRLQVRLTGARQRYTPGETANLALLVSDEVGRPTAAAIGVAVVDDALLSLADDDTPGLTTHFLLTSEVEHPDDLEDADFYLSDGDEAAEALDLLLGTQGWRRFVERQLDDLRPEGGQNEQLSRLAALGGATAPPAMFDNHDQVQLSFASAVATRHRRRAETLVMFSLWGGALLLLALMMMAIVRLASGARLWIAMSLAAASLAIAIAEIQASAISSEDGRLAYQSFKLEPTLVARLGDINAEGAADPSFRLLGAQRDGMANEGEQEGIDHWGFQLGEQGSAPNDLAARYSFFYTAPALEKGRMKLWGLQVPQAGFGGMGGGYTAAGPPGIGGGGGMPRGSGWADGTPMFEQLLGLEAGLQQAQRPGPPLAELLPLQRMGRMRRQLRADAKAGDEVAFLDDLGNQLEQYRFSVRQYAHVRTPDPSGARHDFTETLYWNPLLLADASGHAELTFDVSESITAFRVMADAHDGGGRIGSGREEIVSRVPFQLEPKLPLEVTAGDRIDMPLAVVNETADELPVTIDLSLAEPDAALLQLAGEPKRELRLAAGARRREHYSLDVIGQKGEATLALRGQAVALADAVARKLAIVPPGFPVNLSYAGKLVGEHELTVRLPDEWVPGSLEVTLHAFPSVLADLKQGLESILQEPNGCFEQASTTNYPNVLTLQFMHDQHLADPELTRRSRELLKSGYAKLTSFECPQRGYEWFGGEPGHEALSAYGLMEFRDMARVHEVDAAMLNRTAAWLRSRRNGRGGFERNAQALDSFGGAPADITDAYIVWALAESGEKDLDRELDYVGRLARSSDDPYLVALAAAGTLAGGQAAEGRSLLDKLAGTQSDDGHLTGTNGSITRSGGLSLEVETTALAALAWLKSGEHRGHAERAIEWIVAHRQGLGGFGSTQGTILALKALVASAQVSRANVVGGEVTVKRDGTEIARQTFASGAHNTITIAGIAAQLVAGENHLTIGLSGENPMPYALDVSYRSRVPAGDLHCAVELSTRLDRAVVKTGETVRLSAHVTNVKDEGQPMTIAILGMPAGLGARADQLEEMRKAGTIDFYETRPREIICYWRSLAPKREVTVDLDLIAEVPGRYTAPASRAYLYYTAERKCWAYPLVVEVQE